MTVITTPDTIRNIFADAPDATLRRIALVAEGLAALNDSDDRLPSWDADAYDPTPSDWAEYAAWSRSLDGGCGAAELSPDEQDLLTFSATEEDYWDAVAECDSIHAERTEVWS